MLEKTAAGLEPCCLQRVLPGAASSLRSRRQLHTAFWQHGAADLELTSTWQALMHGIVASNVDPDPASPAPDHRHPALRASSFLLDFLYPSAAQPSLHRLPSLRGERLGVGKPIASFAKVSSRLYSAPAPPPVQVDQADQDGPEVAGASQTSPTTTSTDVSPDHPVHLKKFKALLAANDPVDADNLWHHYIAMDAQARRLYTSQTIVFLSKTGRLTDDWKISELFQQLNPTQWDGPTFLAGLEAEMSLQNLQMALGIFARGLESPELDQSWLVEAFDLLLAAALKMPARDLLRDLWQYRDRMAEHWDFADITNQLSRVSAVPRLSNIVMSLTKTYLANDSKLQGAEVLVKVLVRRALLSCKDRQVLTLLRISNDHLAYEEFLRNSSKSKRGRVLITEVYKVYRGLPDSHPSEAVLHATFQAYKSMISRTTKLAGAEMIWRDWHDFHDRPSRRAYQRHMALWAAHGNTDKVYAMWADYMRIYADAKVLQDDDTFTPLLQVHAVRQELPQVQQTFEDISAKFGVRPNIYCWNILLNSYAKAGDYDGAIATFEKMAELLEPDRYSYGTLMQMSASRGDLAFTVELYRRARRQRVPANDQAILNTLVEVYLHNDHFEEAEHVCARAAHRGVREPRMWNTLVHAYALRRDLASINRVLTRMTELNIPYNEFTYQELLMGLALCQQSHHALNLLAMAIKEKAFDVREEHFHTVMGAFIKTGEPDLAVRIHKLMQTCGYRESADSIVAFATSLNQWEQQTRRRIRGYSPRSMLTSALRRFYKEYGGRNAAKKPDTSPTEEAAMSAEQATPSGLLTPTKAAFQFNRLIFIFTQLKDFVRVRELIDMFRSVAYGDADASHPLPIQMLDSIIWANLSEKKYDELQETWGTMFKLAKEGSLSPEWNESLPHTKRVSPRYHYILSDGLKAMQTMYINEGDVKSLQGIIDEVVSAGFLIDSKNWNLHVQGLAQLHAYREAFQTCERWLMPNWTGWYSARMRENMRNQLPIELRRKGESPRHLRPVAHTLYHLARAYTELNKMAPWSSEVSRMMRGIEKEFPRCYRAITSMTQTGSEVEREIFGDALVTESADPAATLDQNTDEEYEDSEYESLRKKMQALHNESGSALPQQ
jgi:pentatricopeptide repeat-containing protein PET309